MSVSIFDPRTMIEAVKQMKKPRTFIRDRFFSNRKAYGTKHIDFDLVKGKRHVAPFVHAKLPGKAMEKEGYVTKSYTPAMVKPKRITEAEEYLNRSAGESVYNPVSGEEKAAAILGEDFAKLEDMITRREELMCIEALVSGTVTQIGEGISEVVNFDLSGTHIVTLSAGDCWDVFGTSHPLADIDTWIDLNVKDSGFNPDTLILEPHAAQKFISHPELLKMLDNRNVEIGKVVPAELPSGARYLGTLTMYAIDIYSYQEYYIDPADGVEKAAMPYGTAILASSQAGFEMMFGALTDVELGILELERYPKSWVNNDPSAREVQLQSKPLPVPKQVDSWISANVLTALQ